MTNAPFKKNQNRDENGDTRQHDQTIGRYAHPWPGGTFRRIPNQRVRPKRFRLRQHGRSYSGVMHRKCLLLGEILRNSADSKGLEKTRQRMLLARFERRREFDANVERLKIRKSENSATKRDTSSTGSAC
jgi:hypothetical protein